jgi:hypothetical protein
MNCNCTLRLGDIEQRDFVQHVVKQSILDMSHFLTTFGMARQRLRH